MDRLSGKVGPDVEFGAGQEQFQAGKNSFDVASLKDYIAKTEAEKMKDPAYVAKLQQLGLNPLQQTIGGISQTAGTAFSNLTDPNYLVGGALGGDLLTGGDSTAKMAEGGVQAVSGAMNMGLQGENAILKALMNNKIGNSAAGQQIGKLLTGYQDLKAKGLGELTKEGMNMAGGLRDLTQTGRLDQAFAKLSGADAVKNLYKNVGNEVGKGITNVSKSVSTALYGGKTGNWQPWELGTLDNATGQRVQVGSFANKSSQDILNQMLSQHQIAATSAIGNKGKVEGGIMMNELLRYYNAAIKREQGK